MIVIEFIPTHNHEIIDAQLNRFIMDDERDNNMNAIEEIIARLFLQEGYWTHVGFKVNLPMTFPSFERG